MEEEKKEEDEEIEDEEAAKRSLLKVKEGIEKKNLSNKKKAVASKMQKDIKKKKKAAEIRQKEADQLDKSERHVGHNLVMPIYEFDERLKIHREVAPPPDTLFMAMGYNPEHTSNQKHYRKFYDDELENTDVFESPFNSYDIMRGQSRGASKSWFSRTPKDDAGQASTLQKVGEFKGVIRVLQKNTIEAH